MKRSPRKHNTKEDESVKVFINLKPRAPLYIFRKGTENVKKEILLEDPIPGSLNPRHLWNQNFQPVGPSVVFYLLFNSEHSHLNPPFWIRSFYRKELDEYFNPRTVSDDFHDEIGEEELREEVVDEEALETGIKGDQEL